MMGTGNFLEKKRISANPMPMSFLLGKSYALTKPFKTCYP